MEDSRILDLYWQRSEQAIAETQKKYGRYCHYIAFQILYDDQDAEEIVSDTCLRVWNTVPPKRPDPLKPYVGTISRNLALDRYDARNTQKRSCPFSLVLDELSECIPDQAGDIGESIALQQALNTFLRSLPRKTRNVFVRRYYYASSVSEIAGEYKMKNSAVAMLLLRTRNKLKLYLQREGFTL